MTPQNPSIIGNIQTVLISYFKVFTANIGLGNYTARDTNGNGTIYNQDNGSGILVRVGSNANPYTLPNHWLASNTPQSVVHNLGRRPIGFFIASKDKTCDVYNTSPFAANITTISLSITDDTADTLLYIF